MKKKQVSFALINYFLQSLKDQFVFTPYLVDILASKMRKIQMEVINNSLLYSFVELDWNGVVVVAYLTI